jgi:hypothetical protein
MVNNNGIPIEVKKPVETVYELKNEYEVPSFEEFMKTYNEKEGVNDNYRSEFDSYGDLRVKGTYYGPGFWDEIKGFVKPVTSGVLIAASVFPPTAAIAAPITLGVLGTGATVVGIGHVTNDKGLKNFGKDIIDIGSMARDGQDVTSHPLSDFNGYAKSKNK